MEFRSPLKAKGVYYSTVTKINLYVVLLSIWYDESQKQGIVIWVYTNSLAGAQVKAAPLVNNQATTTRESDC